MKRCTCVLFDFIVLPVTVMTHMCIHEFIYLHVLLLWEVVENEGRNQTPPRLPVLLKLVGFFTFFKIIISYVHFSSGYVVLGGKVLFVFMKFGVSWHHTCANYGVLIWSRLCTRIFLEKKITMGQIKNKINFLFKPEDRMQLMFKILI